MSAEVEQERARVTEAETKMRKVADRLKKQLDGTYCQLQHTATHCNTLQHAAAFRETTNRCQPMYIITRELSFQQIFPTRETKRMSSSAFEKKKIVKINQLLN